MQGASWTSQGHCLLSRSLVTSAQVLSPSKETDAPTPGMRTQTFWGDDSPGHHQPGGLGVRQATRGGTHRPLRVSGGSRVGRCGQGHRRDRSSEAGRRWHQRARRSRSLARTRAGLGNGAASASWSGPCNPRLGFGLYPEEQEAAEKAGLLSG